MQTNWQPVHVDQPGVTRYKLGSSRAEIHREADGSAQATLKEGFLGLGTHVTSYMKSPAPNDQAILGKLEDTAHPPRFRNWREVEGGDHNTRCYQGEKENGGKVTAEITRMGGEADVKAQAGFFGVHIEGHYFAPAPSDREILSKISRT